MRTSININRRGFWLNAGWYEGEPFKAFSVEVLSMSKCGTTTFFAIQVARLCFAFGVET